MGVKKLLKRSLSFLAALKFDKEEAPKQMFGCFMILI